MTSTIDAYDAPRKGRRGRKSVEYGKRILLIVSEPSLEAAEEVADLKKCSRAQVLRNAIDIGLEQLKY